MPPLLLAALIQQIAMPELIRWLSAMHKEGRIVTEAEALAKLGMDVDTGNEVGRAALAAHGG